MKLILRIVILWLFIGMAVTFSPPLWTDASGQTVAKDLVPVASFDNGQRFQAGDYPVIVLNGSYREMGRQYGALMKKELNEEYAFIISSLKDRGYTQEQIRAKVQGYSVLCSQRQMELLSGMAETSGLTKDDTTILYFGLIYYLTLPRTSPSCSYLATWGNYTPDGTVVVSRVLDLPEPVLQFNKWYVLTVYRPNDGCNGVATFGPAGMRPETLMNSKGLFIAEDNSGISDEVSQDQRPDLVAEFFRFMLDYSDLNQLMVGIQGARPDGPWIVNIAGPEGAGVYEMTINDSKFRTGTDVVAAANHFIDPFWNPPFVPANHSVIRYENLLRQADKAKGTIDAEKMMQIRDVRYEDGGTTFLHSNLSGSLYSTDHEVVFLPGSRTLWMKTAELSWQKVELIPLFGS